MKSNEFFAADNWNIIEKQFDPGNIEHGESVFSLANGYMGCRGTFEEGLEGGSLEGCYIGGIYAKEPQSYTWKRIGFPDYSNSIINTINWQRIIIEVEGEKFSMAESKFGDYVRCLDMKQGLLTRELVFETAKGSRTRLKWERLISHSEYHIAAIRLGVTALNHSKPVRLQFELDGRRENRDRANNIKHCREVIGINEENGAGLVINVKTTGQYYINRMLVCSGEVEKLERRDFHNDRQIGFSFSFIPQKGKQYNFDKIVSVWTSRDMGYPHGLIDKQSRETSVDEAVEAKVVDFLVNKSKASLGKYSINAYDQIKDEHVRKTGSIWNCVDVEIAGDVKSQQGIRFCLFQLLSTFQGQDGYLNIAPKGFTGENYEGRTFWDSESYCFPFYLFCYPEAAKTLIDYRYNTLGKAKARAKELSYKGAMFPMTTIDGSEDCSVWEYSLCEIHINSTIAYAVYLYDRVCGDSEYVMSRGAELLVEIARFWASRAVYVPYRSGYCINRVIGPDEWQQFVNNNFYTNYMAKWVLSYAQSVMKRVQSQRPDLYSDIVSKTGFEISELSNWNKISENMVLNYDKEMNVFIQDDMFLSLDPMCREQLKFDIDIPIERNWSIEKYLKVQMLKQPDVLLAMFLFRDRFTPEQKASNYRFYEQRTAHGSSLSPSVHSILACELGKYNQAYDYYHWTSRIDLDNRNNNAHEGLHISAMAGTWLNIVAGFGGMQYTGECLDFRPVLPSQWEGLAFKLVYRGSVLEFRVDREFVNYRVVSGGSVKIKLYGEPVEASSEVKLARLQQAKPAPCKAVIFDLDGVVVSTAGQHFKAWKQIADAEGIYFDEKINERLKGVSRMDSAKILACGHARSFSDHELEDLARRKNELYVRSLDSITPADMLGGVREFIGELRAAGIKTAICSASKNTAKVIEKLKVENLFDVIISGQEVKRSKPDPEGFLRAAQKLQVEPESCLVIEDALAGVEGAIAAKMKCIAIGDKTFMHKADYALPSTEYLSLSIVKHLF